MDIDQLLLLSAVTFVAALVQGAVGIDAITWMWAIALAPAAYYRYIVRRQGVEQN